MWHRPAETLLVYEFYRMLPEGFQLLNSTGTIRQLVDADFERQLERIEEAALDLVDNGCDVIILGGSPLFTKLGHGSDTEMGRRLTEKTGRPPSPPASPARWKPSRPWGSAASWSQPPTRTN